ncbi:MAG: nitrilase, partial [Cyclobacteriaceae bacterium]|nr:nitrilase [Cyclobacteriaceae bacterium]
MNKKFTIASAQLTPVFLNKEKTIEKACNAILEAGKKGAKLIVFPEAFISGYPDWVWLIPNSKGPELNELYVKLVDNAISVPDNSTNKLCEAAKQASISVVMGMHERNSETSGTSLFNSLLFINDEGLIEGKHRKLIPTGGERLIWAQGDGSTFQSYNTSAGKIAGLICWENYMPLARNAIYQSGAQILAAPTWDKSKNWLQS